MLVELIRHAYLSDCTLGWLVAGEERFATLSLPWIKNPAGAGGLPYKSCVPDGQYKLIPHDSRDHPNTYQLVNVALGVFPGKVPEHWQYGRESVLLHPGNTTADTEGCIVVASSFGVMNMRPAVVSSVIAFDKLRAILGRDSHMLNIRPTRGTEEP